MGGLDPAFLSLLLHGPARGAEGVPRAPPLVFTGGWVILALASSSSSEATSPSTSAEARRVTGKAPASSPPPGAGGPPQASPITPDAKDGLGHTLELARGSGAVRHELFQEAMGVLSRLGEELADVDARLESEDLRLAHEWHQLKVSINLGLLQHERAGTKAAVSLVTSREACAPALEEARAADQRRQAAEGHERELQALNATLEQWIEVPRAVFASMRGAPSEEKEAQKCAEALVLESLEHSLELERLEVRERQVAMAEDAFTAREAKIQEEVDRRVAKARTDLDDEHRLKLELVEAEVKGRTTALKTKLNEAEQRERAAKASQASAQENLASTRADLLSLQQQINDAASLTKKNADEACRQQTLQREHTSMLQALRVRANRALSTICMERAPHPREEDYASHLHFFTEVVTRLEDQAVRARELVEEWSRGLLGHAFSRVYSHLPSLDPHFDFDAAIAPCPGLSKTTCQTG
nr:plectin-like [Aegilops tauschii subsp. strangulata]